MPTTRSLHASATVSVSEYVCDAGAAPPPVLEQHSAWSISYVRKGSFGCLCSGRRFQLLPGSVLLGRPGDEFTCTHEHHAGGDECLAFFFAPEAVDEVGGRTALWRSEALPPMEELGALGELAQATTQGQADTALDEVGLALAARFVDAKSGGRRAPANASPRVQRKVVNAAMWAEAHSADPLKLDDMAREAGISPYHYLRVFAAVFGITPHQHLVRSRLRHAARQLLESDLSVTDIAQEVGFGDLSNFVRRFHKAAGMSPGIYRKMAREKRNFLQAHGLAGA